MTPTRSFPANKSGCSSAPVATTIRPVRILWGGQDFCFNRHYYNRWRVLLPGAQADYFDSAGHYVLEDAADECLAEISQSLLL